MPGLFVFARSTFEGKALLEIWGCRSRLIVEQSFWTTKSLDLTCWSMDDRVDDHARRIHRKSRSGCLTCKSRHIRCDEFQPKCRNCAKRGCPCRYPLSRLPLNEKEASIDVPWQAVRTGCKPEIASQDQPYESSPQLSVHLAPSAFNLSKQDLRLMHHLLYVSSNLETSNSSNLLTWTNQIPA
jgi:hypothetical protein